MKQTTAKTPRVKNPSTENLRQRLVDELATRYWAKHESNDLLLKLTKRATSYELSTALEEYIAINDEQMHKLIQVFALLEERVRMQQSPELAKLFELGQRIAADTGSGFNTDAAVFSFSRQLLSAEIANYNAAYRYATKQNLDGAAAILTSLIKEEKIASALLDQVVLSQIYAD